MLKISICILTVITTISLSDLNAAIQPFMVPMNDGQSSFSIANCELTWGQWRTVHHWSLALGYDFGPSKAAGDNYPAATLTWYDAIKFCNAASEMTGRQPVYFTDTDQKTIYRKGELDLTEQCINQQANGYRLPTESEWEYACRAGSTTLYYWGDSADPKENPYAWHSAASTRGEDLSPHPVGLKKPNAFGIYDMSGNIAEWCWDRYKTNANWRTLRGGSVALDNDIASGTRSFTMPTYRMFDMGMRLASRDQDCPSLSTVLPQPPDTVNLQPLQPRYEGTDPSAVAQQLFSLMNHDMDANRLAMKLYMDGKPEAALNAYRDQFVSRMRKQLVAMKYSANDRYWRSSRNQKDLNLYQCDADGIVWWVSDERPDNPYDGPRYLHMSSILIDTWIKQQNPSLLAQWFAIAESFAWRGKSDYDNLAARDLSLLTCYEVPQTWHFGMSLSEFSTGFFEVLSRLITTLPEDQMDLIPARALANILIFCATDDVSKSLKDPRNCVGNQQLTVARSLIEMSHIQSDFRDAQAWYQTGENRIVTGALGFFILPDGGDREQSFNYNPGLYKTYMDLANMFKGRTEPDWLEQFHKQAIWRKRMFASLRMPSGSLPSVGNNGYSRNLEPNTDVNDPLYDKLDEQITQYILNPKQDEMPAPAFTSIAFPYSGYYMLRNGWDDDSSSLFFKSSGPSIGHANADNNSIDLVAYGKHLLVNREAPPYVPGHMPESERKDFPWVIEYKGEHAIWMENTLLIDGCGQEIGTVAIGIKHAPIPGNKWYSSPALDYVQSSLQRKFSTAEHMNIAQVKESAEKHGAKPLELEQMLAAAKAINSQPKRRFDATHTRQVIYLRQPNAWVVVDRVKKERSNDNTTQVIQQWHLPPAQRETKGHNLGPKYKGDNNPFGPGFTIEHVTCNPSDKSIITHNPENVNLAILNVTDAEADYKTYFGQKYPYRGWANFRPSMYSGYVPAVDLQATFEIGDMPLVTLIIPIPQGKQLTDRLTTFTPMMKKKLSSFTASFDDGSTVTFIATNTSDKLVLGSHTVHGDTALLLSSQDQEPQGMVIDLSTDSYAFKVINGQIKPFSPIDVPQDFIWRDSKDGMVPIYH